MCMGLGYVIMKDQNNACDSCYKSGDEAQEANKNTYVEMEDQVIAADPVAAQVQQRKQP